MRFRERLTVPISWWVRAAALAVAALTAIGFYLGPAWGIGVGLAAFAVAVAIFASAAIVITVEPGRITIGRGVLEPRYLRSVQALTAVQTERRAGTGADARAHLVLRPYVATSVELTLEDAADPVPYWLVSTRRPGQLVAALQAVGVRPVQPSPDAGPGPGSRGPE